MLAGSNFGSVSPDRGLLLRKASGSVLRIPSADSLVVSWLDERISFHIPPSAVSGTVVVETPLGRSRPVTLDVYRYDTFPVPPTNGTNASPLDLAIDGAGRVWLNQEFHFDSAPLAVLEPGAAEMMLIQAPMPPGTGPFATRIGGADKSTHITELGEGILVDPKGRVWLSEGGGLLYDGPLHNHSRVVCYDPAAPTGSRLRVYNLPGDHNEVTGLAWDTARHLIWLSEGGNGAGPSLVSFDPELVPFDNSFDFTRPVPDESGYRVYPLHGARSGYPAHLMVMDDGSVWFTTYVGNAIGKLDPATGAAVFLPLQKTVSTNPAAVVFGTGGPWDIVRGPGGEIAFNSQFDNSVSRLDASRPRGFDSCLRLDQTGHNPCIRTLSVSGDLEHELVHSASFDASGRLWFSQHASGAAPGTLVSIGYVDHGWSSVVMLPALPTPAGNPVGTAANDGIALDTSTGDIWFAEYFNHRVSRLHRI